MGSGRGDGEERPVARYALERVAPACVEPDTGAGHEVSDRAGCQDLLGLRHRGDARPGVHGDPADPGPGDLALARVYARPHLEAKLVYRVANGAGAADRARGTVEDREESVARYVDLPAAEAIELLARHAEIAVQELAPAPITDRHRPLGGAHNVREQHGDELAIRLGAGSGTRDELLDLPDQHVQGRLIESLEKMVVAGQLDPPGTSNVLAQIASGFDWDGLVTNAVKDQRRGLNRRQDVADIDLVVGLHQRANCSRAGRGPLQPATPLDECLIVTAARGVACARPGMSAM